jgi:HK97 gp10 family phage protein
VTEEVRIAGLRELREALLRTIPIEMQGKVLQKSLAAGTKITLAAARANARRGGEKFPDVITGTLVRAIYAKRSRWGNEPTLEHRIIGVRRGNKYGKNRVSAGRKNMDAYYWKFVEFGHRQGTKTTGYLQKQGRGAGGRSSGFVEPQPFMRPAFESTKNQAAVAIRDALKRQVEDAARKARW